MRKNIDINFYHNLYLHTINIAIFFEELLHTKDYLFLIRFKNKKMAKNDNNDDDNHTDNKHSSPVTVIVKRIAKKDKIKEFEEWLLGISTEVSRQEGSMGIDIIRPTDKSKLEYVVIFRFNNYETLTKWGNSSIRNEWLKKGRELVEADPHVQKLSGLEFWFTPYYNDKSSILALRPPPPLQNGNCYYSCYIDSTNHFSSSNTYFNRNVINSFSTKTYRYYYNSSVNDLFNYASFN